MIKGKQGFAAALLFASLPGASIAQNNVAANVAVPAEPVTSPAPEPEPAEPRDPTSTTPSAPVVTSAPVTVPVTAGEILPDAAGNPYANAYNEYLPLEEERDEGFDDWGLLGLFGLLGLLGLVGRRERVIYVERADTIVPPRA